MPLLRVKVYVRSFEVEFHDEDRTGMKELQSELAQNMRGMSVSWIISPPLLSTDAGGSTLPGLDASSTTSVDGINDEFRPELDVEAEEVIEVTVDRELVMGVPEEEREIEVVLVRTVVPVLCEAMKAEAATIRTTTTIAMIKKVLAIPRTCFKGLRTHIPQELDF